MKTLKDIKMYQEWRAITDKMYGGDITRQDATDQLVKLLQKYDVKTRSDQHNLIAVSYFVYDKDQYK